MVRAVFGGLSDIGYRWYQANSVTPDYPFGSGLSYSSYRWTNVRISHTTQGVRVALDVANTGRRSGADVVQVYVTYPSAAGEPPEQLRGFDKVQLAAGATRHVVIDLPRSSFTYAGSHAMLVAAGNYTVSVGTSSANFVVSQSLQLK